MHPSYRTLIGRAAVEAGHKLGLMTAADQDLAGKVVLVTGRANDIDGLVSGVVSAMKERGAEVKLAAVWNSRGVHEVNGSKQLMYAYSEEYRQPVGGDVDLAVIVVPAIPEPHLIAALCQSSLMRLTVNSVAVVTPAAPATAKAGIERLLEQLGVTQGQAVIGEVVEGHVPDMSALETSFKGTPKLIADIRNKEAAERTRILVEKIVPDVSAAGLHVRDVLPEGWTPRVDVTEMFPHSYDLPLMLKLDPPPATGERKRESSIHPLVTCELWFDADRPFDSEVVYKLLTVEKRKEFYRANFLAADAAGQVRSLIWDGGVPQAVAFGFAWLAEEDRAHRSVVEAADRATAWMSSFGGPRFTLRKPMDLTETQARFDAVRTIVDLGCQDLTVRIWPRGGSKAVFDGPLVWDVFHSMGFLWGDFEYFNWHDPENRGDPLINADGRDGGYDYTVPTDIYERRRDYEHAWFRFNPMRTLQAEHVVRQWARAARFFAEQMDAGRIEIELDDEEVADFETAIAAVDRMVAEFGKMGLAPGKQPIMQLV